MSEKKLRVFEMFAGYGGATFALKKSNIPHEVIGYSEINNAAIQCYEQNHGKIKNYGDCKTINEKELPDFDLLTGGFPCTDVSLAGKRDLTMGRTMLINDVFRIIKEKNPRYLFLENVEGLLSMNSFWASVRYTLMKLGYSISYKLLKSRDYGIPQNRPRVWIFCRKEPFVFMEQVFPYARPLNLFLKDILEEEVDVSFTYKSDQYLERLNYPISKPSNKINVIYNTNPSGFSSSGRIFDTNGVCATLTCTDANSFGVNTFPMRKLTPKECFRLMGFLNDEINLEGISDPQQYKLAGNGWDVSLVSEIFDIIFKDLKVNK